MEDDLMEKENESEILHVKSKSKCVSFLVITSGILAMITCAVTIGTIFGYTYCYIERRCIKPANHTRHASWQIVWPRNESAEARYNRTINGAIMSSVLVSKIQKMACPHALAYNIVGQPEPKIFSNDTVRLTNELGSLPKDTKVQTDPDLVLNDTVQWLGQPQVVLL